MNQAKNVGSIWTHDNTTIPIICVLGGLGGMGKYSCPWWFPASHTRARVLAHATRAIVGYSLLTTNGQPQLRHNQLQVGPGLLFLTGRAEEVRRVVGRH